MTLIFASFFLIYLLFVVVLVAGWNKSMTQAVPSIAKQESLLSIIIPVRNEGKVIVNLLEDIRNQSYKNFEVVVVDDHSRDNTCEAIMPYTLNDKRFKLLNSEGEGKKAALTQGIRDSKGGIIVTTDGDCRVSNRWLTSLSSYFQDNNSKMVFGGVKIEGDSFFSEIQAHEFLSLVGTASATLAFGFPSMCNGANLAFRRSVFAEVEGYSDNLHIPSGDDEFLLRKIFEKYPNGIHFMASSEAVVKTSASVNVKQFIYQRIRWAGKWKYNPSFFSTLLAIFIFCFQSAVILLPIGMLTGWIDPVIGAVLLLSKAIVELIFLKKVSVFLGVPWKWAAFVLLQLVYPFYVAFIGLIANASSFEWKGRKLKSLTVSTIKKIN